MAGSPKATEPSISVVIVTHNRRRDCAELLRSLEAQKIPAKEILVVDDYSVPPLEIKGENPRVRLFRLPREMGLAWCRSFGARMAEGELIAFIDDDAVASANWVEAILENAKRGGHMFGGPCLPLYQGQAPAWWDASIFGTYVGVGNEIVIGCNMQVRKAVFDQIGYLRPGLGRFRGRPLSSEELEFIVRATEHGYEARFCADIIVYHKVRPERLTFAYVLRRAWYQGASYFSAFGGGLGVIMDRRYWAKVDVRALVKKAPRSIILLGILTATITFGYIYASVTGRAPSYPIRAPGAGRLG